MTGQPRLPLAARWLLRLSRVPRATRDEVQADLHELFITRRRDRGLVYAHWRLYGDLASLHRMPRPMAATINRRPAFALLRDARSDLRYAARLFARQPAILLLTIVGLSLGLGIATATFSVMNAAVLRGEGLADPDRAPLILKTTDRSVSTTWKYDEFLHLREGSTRMQVEAVITDAAEVRTAAAEAETPSAGLAFVSGGFFSATGGRVIAGRALEAADEKHVLNVGPPPVVVSFVFWTSRLNQDPAVIGRTIRIGRTDATIVGVTERRFSVPNNRMLWMPLTAYGAVYGASAGMRVPDTGLQVFGRLLPDVSLSEAQAQLSGVASTLPYESQAAGDSSLRVRLDPDKGLGRVSGADALAITLLVFAVIGLVLVLACANVATVLVSTAITREREMGLRAALGASRRRILRQLVTESLALGAVAAVISLLFVHWAMPIIVTMIEAPAGTDLAPDGNVFFFLGFITLLTAVTAGLAPAWHGRDADLVTPLKGGEGARPNRVAPRRLRFMLVTTQAAISVLLMVMSALFVRAAFRAAAIDVGFDAKGLYAVSVGFGYWDETGGARIRNFWARTASELQAIPGVAAFSLVELPPFSGGTRTSVSRDEPSRVIHVHLTGAEYFETLGLRTLAGRTYTPGEVAAKAPVAVVSESLARSYWPDQSPLGQVLPQRIPMSSTRPVVIGVVADTITASLHESNAFAVYSPLSPAEAAVARLLIRVAPGATGAIDQATQRLRAIDPDASVRVASVDEGLQQEARRPRTLALLTSIVGIIAIVLCVIGLYGLTASLVGQRTREMGVRVAMGAEPGDLLRLLMWDSLRPVLAGLAVGVAAALVAGRLLVAVMFFNVSPQDPLAIASGTFVLLAAATLAVLVPTRRAATLDAAVVLRQS